MSFEDAAVQPETPAVEPSLKPRRSIKKWVIAAVAAVAVGLIAVNVVAATPQARVIGAVQALGEAKDLDLAISFAVTEEAMLAAGATDAQMAAMGLPGITTVKAAAAALELARLRILTHSGESIDASRAFYRLEYAGEMLAMMGIAERAFYLQLNLDGLAQANPPLQSAAAVAEEKAGLLEMFSWLQAGSTIVEGNPVMLSFGKDSPLASLWDDSLGAASAGGDAEAQLEAFRSAMIDGLKSSTSVSEDGTADGLDRILVSVDGSKFASSILAAWPQSLTDAGLDAKSSGAELKAALKGKSLDFRFLFDGDNLKRIEFDLSAFADKELGLKAEGAVLRIEFGNEQSSVPSDAVDITEELAPLLSMFTGLDSAGT